MKLFSSFFYNVFIAGIVGLEHYFSIVKYTYAYTSAIVFFPLMLFPQPGCQ
jgi:hypothetical protein